jgi:hypothetical protein
MPSEELGGLAKLGSDNKRVLDEPVGTAAVILDRVSMCDAVRSTRERVLECGGNGFRAADGPKGSDGS